MGRRLDASLAVLNGLVGDYLAKTGNGLATDMALLARSHDGARLPLKGSPGELVPNGEGGPLMAPSPRVAVFVHGLMCTESVWTMPDGTDYGVLLEHDLRITPLYVRYNSGLPVAESGAALARTLESLVQSYPIPLTEIAPIGYSMGGLVVRSACHQARLRGGPWLAHVRRAIYLGTPHLGSPLERAGRLVTKLLRTVPDPYTRLLAELGDLRSIGVKDLGDGLCDPRHPVPLLPEIQHYLVAGSLSGYRWIGALFGDAMVPVPSATDGHVDPRRSVLPPSHVKVIEGLSHMKIAHDATVYETIRGWLTSETGR